MSPQEIQNDIRQKWFLLQQRTMRVSYVGHTPKNEVNVFATYMKDYQTKVKHASNEQISDLMDYDPFFPIGGNSYWHTRIIKQGEWK